MKVNIIAKKKKNSCVIHDLNLDLKVCARASYRNKTSTTQANKKS